MNRIILAVTLASIMMGCSTAYRTGQTPDDVYFSPVREESGYVNAERNDGYRASEVPLEDRYLRMKTQRRSRWNTFDDDFAYWNNPYWNNRGYFDFYTPQGMIGFNNIYHHNPFMTGYGFYGNPFSPVFYGQPVIIVNNVRPSAPRANAPRTYNLNNYRPSITNVDPKFGTGTLRSTNQYYNPSGTPRGGYNPRSSGNSSGGNPVRTFSNSSNSSSSGSSNSSSSGSSSSGTKSSSAPVRSFPRGSN
ncbi:MAG: hypothetical protein ACK5AO_03135 [bacterium]